MGGGPDHTDVIRASCVLTFPEEFEVEPIPIDGWFLHAAGIVFVRQLARERLGQDCRIALILQKRGNQGRRRYVSVSSDQVLLDALEETFVEPDCALMLHIIALDKVQGRRSIHVRPELNPNVSPEPVAPLTPVFPTLAVEGLQHVGEAPTLAASLSQSAFFPRKGVSGDLEDKPLSWSISAIPERADEKMCPVLSSLPSSSSITSTAEDAVHQAIPIADTKDQQEDYNSIPLARVVDIPQVRAEVVESNAGNSDYVVLEVHNMNDRPVSGGEQSGSTPMDLSSSRYVISTSWHVQAEEMSASMRINPPSRRPSPRQTSDANSLVDSFVFLEHQ